MIPLTFEDEQKHQGSNTCIICGRDGFCNNNSCKGCWNCFYLGGKFHHHNHLKDGYNYIGSAHFKCNINIRKDKFIVRIFALCNFTYDFEHVLEGLGQSYIDWKLEPIAQSENHMISVKWGPHYRFIDFYRFIDSSLEKMIADVAKDNTDAFHITKELFKKVYPSIELKDIEIAKGGMCYTYLNEQTIAQPDLPDIEYYTNDLTGEKNERGKICTLSESSENV